MKRAITLSIVILLIIMSSSLVTAWGINPARQRAAPISETQYLSVTLENTQGIEGYFKVSFSGNLAPYAKYGGQVIYVNAFDNDYIIPFSLKLPEDMQPGTNKLSVNLEQISSGSSATVSSLITLVADVNVEVPVEGNHVIAKLAIGQSETQEPTPITVSIINQGENNVAVWADVSIRGPTNKEITSWTTDKTIITFQGTGKIATNWNDQKEPGLYYAEVTLHHDDKIQILRQTFMVGSREVISEDISADNFNLGTVVPFTIHTRNKWNEPIENVFAEVFVLSTTGSIIQTFKTASEKIPGLGTLELLGYWDTSNIVVGSYDLNVVMHFGEDGQSQESYPVVVKANALEVQNKVSGQVTGGGNGSEDTSSVSFLVLLVGILIIVNVVGIFFLRKTLKKKNN